MQDEVQSGQRMPRGFSFLRLPLFRLLAINLATGTALAVLLVGGLLVLNPAGLRDLIFADRAPLTALGLLLFGFVVTLGSAVMGTAIMAMGQADDQEPRGPPPLVTQALSGDAAPTSRQRESAASSDLIERDKEKRRAFARRFQWVPEPSSAKTRFVPSMTTES